MLTKFDNNHISLSLSLFLFLTLSLSFFLSLSLTHSLTLSLSGRSEGERVALGNTLVAFTHKQKVRVCSKCSSFSQSVSHKCDHYINFGTDL